ncbi:hypothetical protein FOZ62_019284 [Perkinsus olseni]|uniref:Uncharacterized protein n=1 Tax=Perkinsus olseni TaxID=32597 RepID=A0A7J6QRA3_PEROL|nr:hypothetical protein FOZ62_019284 [Perkinsus olseni]
MVLSSYPALTVLAALPSVMALQAASKPQIKANAESCKIDYGESSIYLRKSSDDYLIRWEATEPRDMSAYFWINDDDTMAVRFTDSDRARKDNGPSVDMQEKYARVYPFAPLINTIKQAFRSGMSKGGCAKLANTIKATPPEEYKDADNWMGEFFVERMAEALELCGPYPKPQRFGDISEKTKFITVQLPRNADGLLASPSTFTAPPGCSPDVRILVENYCVSGTFDVKSTVNLNINLNVFDVEIPNKKVVVGLQTTLDEGDATTITGSTGGCATILKETLVVTACTSGGGKGKYDSALSAYVSDIGLSGHLKLDLGTESTTEHDFALPGYVYAGDDFDMGMVASAFNSSGDPKVSGINATFLTIMDTLNASLFDWRVYTGLTVDIWDYPQPVLHREVDFINTVIHLV